MLPPKTKTDKQPGALCEAQKTRGGSSEAGRCPRRFLYLPVLGTVECRGLDPGLRSRGRCWARAVVCPHVHAGMCRGCCMCVCVHVWAGSAFTHTHPYTHTPHHSLRGQDAPSLVYPRGSKPHAKRLRRWGSQPVTSTCAWGGMLVSHTPILLSCLKPHQGFGEGDPSFLHGVLAPLISCLDSSRRWNTFCGPTRF